MEHKGIMAGVLVLLVLIGGMFIFAYLKKVEIENSPTVSYTGGQDDNIPYSDITRIDAKHFYIDGTHTVAGEILFPTPCDLLNWDTLIAESYPEQVTINFSVTNYADTCAAVQTAQRFKIDFSASEDATIRARFEGRSVELNLIPAGEGESPDEFELFIKG